ncbi:FAD-dependent monooxygenase [Salinispora tropica]|uniref:FAD-dependent monooxygenase n=1 Tax=Salinispora tropica TaxID=168695 RepID=UPI00048B3F76|nr:FAD-dependent monooxygenase [Salinispora tropica]
MTVTPVVIVGAGPVGLLLAVELGRARVPVVVVERLADPMTESRAGQLSTLTAELLHERGLHALLAEAGHEPRAHFAGLGFDLSGLDSAYRGNWKVPQYRTEAVLGEHARRRGVTVLRGHELTGLTAGSDHVVCQFRGPTGRQRLKAGFVVGCDGSGSTVRRLWDFPVSATAATRELLRADVTGLRIRDRRFERRPAGLAVAATRAGVTRVMVHVAGQPVTARAGRPEFGEVVRAWAAVTGEDLSGGTPVWLDAFDNSRGQVGAYRRGRVLLAGDAAHWHLPIGGQALNVGLQDAVNLGWKLAAAVHGWAAPGLLDSYHDERHPVAARVLDHVTAQETLLLGGAEVEPLRAILAELVGLRPVHDHLAETAANLSDRCGPPGPPPIGRRATNLRLRTDSGPLPMAGTEPVIVRLSSGADSPHRTTVRTVHATYDGAPPLEATALLLRPDGYVAWAGDDEEGLEQAIEKLLWVEGRKGNARL